MIAADIHVHQTACLDKCNRIVSNLISSPSFGCIYVMTRTLNPAVVLSLSLFIGDITSEERSLTFDFDFDLLTLTLTLIIFDFDFWRYYVRGTRKRPRTALSTLTSKSPPEGYVFIM